MRHSTKADGATTGERLTMAKSRLIKPKVSDRQDPRGRASTGKVAAITRGRADGFIRDQNGDRLYFNRRDVLDEAFNSLEVGDAVAFEIIEDKVSGHRATRVARKK